ncbi:menaquinone biosynthetic enzyme MqnA/MqnD family protein [Desulfurispora thermophila]|uniref:menaquinone biosynthetic enzyme MqnA/MqnD family protein n=1 Tax=Desulfurispora thermophila TaxID=265470 RepID=UPI00036EC3BA|nr:menaquinone biosynthesis protein [Desulfurispora thermophila]
MLNLRLGRVSYLNCLPVYYALEKGLLPFAGELFPGPPTMLNKMLLENKLHITPISSIEYAKNAANCIILPDLAIGADGRVESILFFSKLPVTELEHKRVLVTTSSATSVALLRILFEHYYHVDVEMAAAPPDITAMLNQAEGALLIGDDAIAAHRKVILENWDVLVTDLGLAWKEFTGCKMIYALWVTTRQVMEQMPDQIAVACRLLHDAYRLARQNWPDVIEYGHKLTGFSRAFINDYLDNLIQYSFHAQDQQDLMVFYDYAYKSGILDERAVLHIWEGGNCPG